MQNYYAVEEISNDLNISKMSVYKKARKLGINTKKIGKKEKNLLIKELKPLIELKEDKKSDKKQKTDKKSLISKVNGSSLMVRLENAKNHYDKLETDIYNLELDIEENGYFIKNTNYSRGINPSVKIKADLLNRYNSLNSTINDLEEKLKLSKPQPKVYKVIDDE